MKMIEIVLCRKVDRPIAFLDLMLSLNCNFCADFFSIIEYYDGLI